MSQLGYNSNRPKSTPFTTLTAIAATAKKADAVISVFCEMCPAHATGTREQLQELGWGIYARDEFCPTHESEI